MSKKQFQAALDTLNTSVGFEMKTPYDVIPSMRFNVLVENGTIPSEAIVDVTKLIMPAGHDAAKPRAARDIFLENPSNSQDPFDAVLAFVVFFLFSGANLLFFGIFMLFSAVSSRLFPFPATDQRTALA